MSSLAGWLAESEMSPTARSTPHQLLRLDDFNSISLLLRRNLSSCERTIMPFNFSELLSSATNESRRQLAGQLTE